MLGRSLVAAVGIAASVVGVVPVTTPARAQDAREAEIIGFHQLCEKGDRRACVRFGVLIGENRQRHADWRRAHTEWFWWDR